MSVKSLPPRRTLNGKFDAYCRVCWNPVYALWIDDADPGGVCPHGATVAHECSDAMAHARSVAMVRRAMSTIEGEEGR